MDQDAISNHLADAQSALAAGLYESALSAAIAAIALISAARAGQQHPARIMQSDLMPAEIIAGLAEFHTGAVDQAATFLVRNTIPQNTVLSNTQIENEDIAAITAIAVIATGDRAKIVRVLTDSVNSPAKEFFDTDIFSVLKEVGLAVNECEFGKARRLLANLEYRTTDLSTQLEFVQSRFVKFCVMEYVSCFSEVNVEAIATELGIEEGRILEILEELIPEPDSRIGSYRIDLEFRKVVRLEVTDAQREMMAAANIETTLRELQMLALRKSFAEHKIEVE